MSVTVQRTDRSDHAVCSMLDPAETRRLRTDRRSAIDPDGTTIGEIAARLRCHSPDPDWRASAACASTDVSAFYTGDHRPDAGAGGPASIPAREACWSCPVRWDCLHHAIGVRERHGIWGGLDAYQRERIRRRHRDAYDHVVTSRARRGGSR